jgi:hypothetical protein
MSSPLPVHAVLCTLTGIAAIANVLHPLVRARGVLEVALAIVSLSLTLLSAGRYGIRWYEHVSAFKGVHVDSAPPLAVPLLGVP